MIFELGPKEDYKWQDREGREGLQVRKNRGVEGCHRKIS